MVAVIIITISSILQRSVVSINIFIVKFINVINILSNIIYIGIILSVNLFPFKINVLSFRFYIQ